MPDFNPNQRICDVLQRLDQGKFRLPNIQRGYEWDPQRVLKLFDSIMNGYPIGAIMIWQPPAQAAADIRTRRFIKDYVDTHDYLTDAPHAMDAQEPLFVLDGQQRLQSLYLGVYGSYNGRRVYLQIDHRPTSEDEDYRFQFLTPAEAAGKPWLVPLGELVQLNFRTRGRFVDEKREGPAGSDAPADGDERRAVITENVDRFLNYFTQEAILLFQIVPGDIDYDHILEIFERVNSGGMVLSKSDLLFCTLKLQLAQAEEEFASMLRFLNQGGRHQFTTDFLIKTCLVAFGKGAKYEVAKLKDPEFVQAIEGRMGEWTGCLRQLYAWLEETARIKCGRFLRSQSALIPIVDYMLASGNRDKPDGENSQRMLEYLHMAFIKRLFSRSADSVLDRLHGIVEKQVRSDPARFPIEAIRSLVAERSGMPYVLHERDFLADADLMLNIVDGGRLQQDPADPDRDPKDLKLELDHIFPRSMLIALGMSAVADHLGNYRLIVMPANRRKQHRMPDANTDFFGRGRPEVESAYQAALSGLDQDTYLAFRDARAALIRSEVSAYLGVGLS
jgi:uncharacterized protein DUF262